MRDDNSRYFGKEELTEELQRILFTIRDRITDECDVVCSRYDNPAQARTDIDNYVLQLKGVQKINFDQLAILFAATGAFQEISISNGWGKKF